MSTPSEKLGVNLAEAVATLEQLREQFELEKEALVAEKDEEIEKVKQELEAEKSKLRATRQAFEAVAEDLNLSEDGALMVYAVDLNITWSNEPEYWAWTTVSESRHAVAELLNVCWLEISCQLDMEKLSPHTNYASYLVYKFTEENNGFEFPPGEASAGILGEENSLSKIYLVPEEDQEEGSERADKYPMMRPDGWMEVELGEYFIDELETFGEIEMGFKEVKGSWKKGLIVQGIEVRPKEKSIMLESTNNAVALDTPDEPIERLFDNVEDFEQVEVLGTDDLKLTAERSKFTATKLALEASGGWSNVTKNGCYMVFAVDLDIMSIDDEPEYWTWITMPESRHAVAKLLEVCWLDISCQVDTVKLLPRTNYASYLVYKLSEKHEGFTLFPGEVYVCKSTLEKKTLSAYLVPEVDQLGPKRAARYPSERADGWMELELGEFFTDDLEGKFEMRFREVEGSWKKGLLVKGIELRPKETC